MSKHSTDLQIFKYCLLLFWGWKIVLTLISYFGLVFLPVSLPELHIGKAEVNTDYWIRWANWDGGHFRGIAENGYLHSFQVVFFPLYPVLINLLMFFNKLIRTCLS